MRIEIIVDPSRVPAVPLSSRVAPAAQGAVARPPRLVGYCRHGRPFDPYFSQGPRQEEEDAVEKEEQPDLPRLRDRPRPRPISTLRWRLVIFIHRLIRC